MYLKLSKEKVKIIKFNKIKWRENNFGPNTTDIEFSNLHIFPRKCFKWKFILKEKCFSEI